MLIAEKNVFFMFWIKSSKRVITLLQILIASADITIAGAVMYVLLPAGITPGQRASIGARKDSSKIQRLSNQPCSPLKKLWSAE